MKMVALGEVAELNPRAAKIEMDDDVSFVGMAQLDAISAQTDSGITRRFGDVSKSYTIFQNSDILVAKITPCFENNKIGQARLQHSAGVGSTEFHVVRPRELLDHRYLLHYLRQDRIRAEGELRMTGSAGQRRVPANYLEELRIPLPPLPEQRRIAEILDHADALRAKRRQVIAHLGDLEQSIFLNTFGDPVRNERSWPSVRLGDLGNWRSGATPPRSSPQYFRGNIPWFSSGELGNMYVQDSKEHVAAAALTETALTLVTPGSLMLGMYDTAALKSSIATQECTCNQAVAYAVVESAAADTVYVYTAIQVSRSKLRALQRGIRQKNLNLSIVRDIQIALPTIRLQRDYATAVESIRSTARLASTSLHEMDSLFASLQSRAFRGEL